jgi:hypothetical protein
MQLTIFNRKVKWQSGIKWAMLVVAFSFYIHFTVTGWSYLADDPLIFYRYALNFHHGYGWVMNPFDRSNGCTSFLELWLVSSLTSFESIDWCIEISKVAGFLCGLATLVLTLRITRLAIPGVNFLPEAAVLALATRPDFALSMINGMETCFAVLFLVAGIYWLIRSLGDTSTKTDWPMTFCFIFAALFRPELLVQYPILAGLRYLAKRPIRLYCLLVYVVVCSVPFVFNITYYHKLFPNAYYAKYATLTEGLLQGGQYCKTFLLPAAEVGGAIVLLVGLALLILNRRTIIWPVVVSAIIHALFLLRTHGDWMVDGRLACPATPLMSILLVVSIYSVLETAVKLIPSMSNITYRAVATSLGVFFALCIISDCYVHSFYISGASRLISPRLPGRVPLSSWTCGAVDGPRVIADWINLHAKAGDTVVCSEMGVVPILCPTIRFVDSWGLTDSTVARMKHYRRSSSGVETNWSCIGRNNEMHTYVNRVHPKYIILPNLPDDDQDTAKSDYVRIEVLRVYVDPCRETVLYPIYQRK